jgi:hypothetical protein
MEHCDGIIHFLHVDIWTILCCIHWIRKIRILMCWCINGHFLYSRHFIDIFLKLLRSKNESTNFRFKADSNLLPKNIICVWFFRSDTIFNNWVDFWEFRTELVEFCKNDKSLSNSKDFPFNEVCKVGKVIRNDN